MKWLWGVVPAVGIIGLSVIILCTKRPATAMADVQPGPNSYASSAPAAPPSNPAPTPAQASQVPDPSANPPSLAGGPLDLLPDAPPAIHAPEPVAMHTEPSAPAKAAPVTLPTPMPTFAPPKLSSVPTPVTPSPAAELSSISKQPVISTDALAATATLAANNAGVQLEWVGSTALQVGRVADFSLIVRNRTGGMVHDATVHVQAPTGIDIKGTAPPATKDHDALVWHFETLLPGQVTHLHVNLMATSHGQASPRAWVTFTSEVSASLALSTYEPKLAVRTSRPTRVVLGDTTTFTLNISNGGDGPAENVVVHTLLSPGLRHPRGSAVDFDLGNLGAGESRDIQLVCTASGGGPQRVDATVLARAGVRATDQAAIKVLAPRLDMQVNGPTIRYVERRATYTMFVSNQGDFPAYNVSVSEALPEGFNFLLATADGHYDAAARTIAWFLGELGPGQTREVQFDVIAAHAGNWEHRLRASAERGGRLEVERRLTTRVEDISALLLEVSDSDDPIEVGKETVYEIVVTNAGSKTESDIKLVCQLPEQLSFRAAQGPARYQASGNSIVFEPVAALAPRGELVYKITTRAHAPGQVHFQARLTGAGLSEPITRTEGTRIYADRP